MILTPQLNSLEIFYKTPYIILTKLRPKEKELVLNMAQILLIKKNSLQKQFIIPPIEIIIWEAQQQVSEKMFQMLLKNMLNPTLLKIMLVQTLLLLEVVESTNQL